MAIRKTLTSLAVAGLIFGASAAHAGKDTVPNAIATPPVAAVNAALSLIGLTANSIVANEDGTLTVTLSNGQVGIVSSRFMARLLASY